MINLLFRLCYKIIGWKLVGNLDPNTKQSILAVCPHNRTADFTIGLFVRAAMKINVRYLGKAELFNGPFGFFFRAMGGTPVVRTANNNMVDNIVETFKTNPDLNIAIAPEGTRRQVSKIRTGFYFIALKANLSIIMVGFDFPRKTVFVANPFKPSGDFEKDMQEIFVPFFRTIQGPQKEWMDNYEKGIFDKK